MNTEILYAAAAIREAHTKTKLQDARSQVLYHVDSLQRLADKIQSDLDMQYTDHAVLLKKTETGWQCVDIINTANLPETLDIDFDLILSIPDPDTMTEFEGF